MVRYGRIDTRREISEPKIHREEILVLVDDDFNTDNVCIVTGAARGIGRATAVAAAANGLMTVGLDVDADGGEATREIAHAMGGRMVFVRADLAHDEDIEHAIRVAASLGTIKYLANIAGIRHPPPGKSRLLEQYDLMHRIMLRAPFYLSSLVIGQIRRTDSGSGVIGNMALVQEHLGALMKSAHTITKLGIRALSQSISTEGEGRVRSFTVSADFVRPDLALDQIPSEPEPQESERWEVGQDAVPAAARIEETMSPIDVANVFLFGFSRYSRYLVGEDLLFDGGVLIPARHR